MTFAIGEVLSRSVSRVQVHPFDRHRGDCAGGEWRDGSVMLRRKAKEWPAIMVRARHDNVDWAVTSNCASRAKRNPSV